MFEEIENYRERPDKIALYRSLDENPLVHELNARRNIIGLTERILAIDKVMSRDVTKFVNDKHCILNIGILARKDPYVRREIEFFGNFEGYRNDLIKIRDTDVLEDAFNVAYLSEIENRQPESDLFSGLIRRSREAVDFYKNTGKLDLELFAESKREALESKNIDLCAKIVLDYSYKMKKMNALSCGENRMNELLGIQKACFPYDLVFERPIFKYLGYMGIIHQQRIILIGNYVGKEIRITK